MPMKPANKIIQLEEEFWDAVGERRDAQETLMPTKFVKKLEPLWNRDGIALYVGDCRELVPSLLPDKSVDMVWTDPPYGHNNNNGDLIHRWEEALGVGESGPARAIANDGAEDASNLVRWLFAESVRVLAPGCCCCCCCCGGGGPDPQFARWSLWMDEALQFKQMIVFDKGPMGMGWHFRRSYETILVAQQPGAACRWFDETKRIENIIRPGAYGIKKVIPDEHQHPTEKPPELAEHFMRLHTQRGDLVLDPFLGSGSTALAARRLGRRLIGIDLDRAHVENAIDRLKNAEGAGFMMDMRKRNKIPKRTRA